MEQDAELVDQSGGVNDLFCNLLVTPSHDPLNHACTGNLADLTHQQAVAFSLAHFLLLRFRAGGGNVPGARRRYGRAGAFR